MQNCPRNTNVVSLTMPCEISSFLCYHLSLSPCLTSLYHNPHLFFTCASSPMFLCPVICPYFIFFSLYFISYACLYFWGHICCLSEKDEPPVEIGIWRNNNGLKTTLPSHSFLSWQCPSLPSIFLIMFFNEIYSEWSLYYIINAQLLRLSKNFMQNKQ